MAVPSRHAETVIDDYDSPVPGPVARLNHDAVRWWDMAVENAGMALAGITPASDDSHPDLASGMAAVLAALPPFDSQTFLCIQCRYALPRGQMATASKCRLCLRYDYVDNL